MTDAAKPADPKSERDRRLAEALRQNLRRRKSQARGRSTEPPKDDTSSTDS